MGYSQDIFPKQEELHPQISDQGFDFMKNEVNLNDKGESDHLFGNNFDEFDNKDDANEVNPELEPEPVADQQMVSEEVDEKPDLNKVSEQEPQSPVGSNKDTPMSPKGAENVSDNVEPRPTNLVQTTLTSIKYLQKKPVGASTPLVKQADMDVKDDHSYMTNINENKSNFEERSGRSARNRPNPKIWGDEYVTSLTGKRKNMQLEHADDKPEPENDQVVKRVPIKKRETKVEVGFFLIINIFL